MEQVGRGGIRWRRSPGGGWHHAVVLIGLALAASVFAADQPLEYQVKAAFLLNFTKFIEWPPEAFGSAASPLNICIFGDNPFGDALDQIVNGETVNGRKVTVQYIRQAPAAQSCQVLFFSAQGKELKSLPDPGPGVLTVGQGGNFIRDGGMIAFVIENNRVRFEINQRAAERGGLMLSSRLLSVAKSVEK